MDALKIIAYLRAFGYVAVELVMVSGVVLTMIISLALGSTALQDTKAIEQHELVQQLDSKAAKQQHDSSKKVNTLSF